MMMTNAFHSRVTIPAPPRLASVKKFYFLDYFYVLLKSIERYSPIAQVFDAFKTLKLEHRLGESKYKRLTDEEEALSPAKLNRYHYTFLRVIEEAKEYGLVEEGDSADIMLTASGRALILQYDNNGQSAFNRQLFRLMEGHYGAFRYLVELLYSTDTRRRGLLVLPMYSPGQLGFDRSAFRTTNNIIEYSQRLSSKLEDDLEHHLGVGISLAGQNNTILQRLIESELIPEERTAPFNQTKYNVIAKRFRDFWINYLLRAVYGYEHSASSFDLWTYRGKQIGIIHATEFYPGFNGRIVYPTSVVATSTNSADFDRVYTYPDSVSMFVHHPASGDQDNSGKFISSLVDSYFDLRRSNRNYFVNLSALREMVCYSMKISEELFAEFLDNAYRLNLKGELRIQISLEVDRLPEETNAIYLKREPVMVDGRYRNIIGIDVAKGAS